MKLNKYINYSVFDIVFETNVYCLLRVNPPSHAIVECICWQFYAVAGPENSWNSFTDVEIRYRYLSLISIVHWIVDLYFCKWYKLKVAASIFTEEFGAERERQTENVHVFYRQLSEGKIATKVIFMYLKVVKKIFIEWTWLRDVRIVMRNHKKDWDLYPCKYTNKYCMYM